MVIDLKWHISVSITSESKSKAKKMKLATLSPVLLVLLVLFDCSMAQFGGGGFGRMGGMRGFGKIFLLQQINHFTNLKF